MNNNERGKLAQALIATCIACSGNKPNTDLLKIYEDAMSGYDLETSLGALRRCYREHKGHLSPSDIIGRIDDGWPSDNEAWSLCPRDESASVVTCREILQAHADATDNVFDPTAARMAFREIYARARQQAVNEGRTPEWFLSLGADKLGRARAAQEGVRCGRLTGAQAEQFLALPPPEQDRHEAKQLVGEVMDRAEIRKMIGALPFMGEVSTEGETE